jgi:hypothetical protein
MEVTEHFTILATAISTHTPATTTTAAPHQQE